MTLELGQKLRIRTMVYIAGEPIPFFWPMRSFIHHNPLHGLEELPFHEAVQAGERLFHGRGFLPRSLYNSYLGEGRVDRNALEEGIAAFVARQAAPVGKVRATPAARRLAREVGVALTDVAGSGPRGRIQ